MIRNGNRTKKPSNVHRDTLKLQLWMRYVCLPHKFREESPWRFSQLGEFVVVAENISRYKAPGDGNDAGDSEKAN